MGLLGINYWWIGGIGIGIVLIIILVCMFISYYNRFVTGKNNVEESFSTMDTHLKQRHDLIPNLVATVKGLIKNEKETLSSVIEARNLAANSTTLEDKIKNEAVLNNSLKGLACVVDKYPELKEDSNFISLQQDLKNIENNIADARQFYNARVKTFNNSIEGFPGVLFAKMYKFKKYSFYIVDAEQERKNIKVEF